MPSPNRSSMNGGAGPYTSPSYGQSSQNSFASHNPPPYSQPPSSNGFGMNSGMGGVGSMGGMGPNPYPPQNPMDILRGPTRPQSPLNNLSGITGVGNAVGISTLLPGNNQAPGTMQSSMHCNRRELYRRHSSPQSYSHSNVNANTHSYSHSHALVPPFHPSTPTTHFNVPSSPDTSPLCIPFRAYTDTPRRIQTSRKQNGHGPPSSSQYLHCGAIDDHILSCFIDQDRERHL